VIANGRIFGTVLFVDSGDVLWYLELILSGASIAAIRDDLMFGRALAECSLPKPLAA
jgi:nitrite reductase (NADH) large subunit